MKQPHKHAELIKAWADGAEIECKDESDGIKGWRECVFPIWDEDERVEYRIKPQPKEPQYLYVYDVDGEIMLWPSKTLTENCIGKIKLEVDDE